MAEYDAISKRLIQTCPTLSDSHLDEMTSRSTIFSKPSNPRSKRAEPIA